MVKKNLMFAAFCVAAIPAPVCYDNSNSAYVPQMWANESLWLLDDSVVMANLVHRDFQNEVQSFGDTINTRRPRKFKSMRKTMADSVVEQDAISDNVQVKLDQHHYNTFIIKDEESSKSFKDLVEIYLRPAVEAVGRGIDRSTLGQAHRFFRNPANRVGGLGTGSSSTIRSNIVAARERLNVASVPEDNMRHLVVAPGAESDMLNTDLFTKVNESGSANALRRAQIGTLFGFDIYAANNTPAALRENCDVATGTITNAITAGAAISSQACSITGYEVSIGEYFTIAGNDQPQFATAVTASVNTTAITPNEVNKSSTSGSAVVTVWKKFLAAAAYSAGYSKEIAVDGYTIAPTAGRMVSIGTGVNRRSYNIIEAYTNPANSSETLILLDRPLEFNLGNNDPIFPVPAGEYNLAFHKHALALVNRPLALPSSSLGVMAANANNGSLSMRIVMQYDSKAQGTRVTIDTLMGVALLDESMGVLVLS